ncbi:MAG: tetratricopeptide repeat protein [Anaerolineae bacterium]|nr:tetratricopeptide repeat protein [Anaerolineae bacterium]
MSGWTLGQPRHASHMLPHLQRLAVWAYEDALQATKLLENCELAPEVVARLLAGHGPLLVVADDVWSEEALAALKAALPDECSLLITTRDYDVAFSLEDRAEAIQQLDVLSKQDARVLLQSKVDGLEANLADRLATGLGHHAQALTLAAGSLLARRKVQPYTNTVEEILQRVAVGRGFGDLPRLDKAERLNKVEVALKYSYDYLGESTDGANRQAWLRALGVFAQEADFDTAAAASVWALNVDAAREALLLLDGLALIQATREADHSSGGRWQQHAILRAYALSLQDEQERLVLPQRHADYFMELAQASIPSATERVEQEFKQIEHAFAWCQQHSPGRATRLANITSQVMFIRGRAAQAGEWLRVSIAAADQTGDRSGKANTLQSLGDLERRLGNLDAARRHFDAALPLYEAEQARLGKANTLQSLGDLESRLGNLDAARRHFDAALPLYEAEQDRLGKANTLKSLGDLERRLGNLDAARRHFDAALPLYEAEQARLGKANTLQSLGDLESRLGNLDAARRHFDAALPLYEAEQARLGKANTLKSLGDLESRLGNLDAARRHFDAALPLYEAEQARLGKANTLKSLGDLESRLGNLDAARRHFDAALPLYEAEQDRLGKANTLQSLGDLERRLGNLDAARRHFDAALPLYEAEQARLGKANTLKSLGDLESRLGNLDAARRHFDAALPLYEAEQARLGKANTLKSLGDLESRLGNLDAARRHFDAALPLYEAEQDRLGKANTLQSLGELESRLGNLDAARRHFDAALPLYEAEQDRLGKANTLKSLGDLERRLGNLDAARRHFDAALPLYEAEQARLGKANTLQSLGDLESRLGNLDAARRHFDAALPLYEAEQARLGKANTLKSLGDLERRLGNLDAARRHFDAALPLYEAEQDRLGKANTLQSLGDLESRLGNLDAARRHFDAALDLYRLEQEPGGIINTLVSQARLEAGTGNLDLARPLYEQAFRVADQTGYANHPIVQDLRREYATLRAASTEAAAADDPLALALSALREVDSDQALAQALADHPVLHEAQALFALAGQISQALADQERETVTRLAILLVVLLGSYNQAHSEQLDVRSHAAVIDLCEQVIPLADQLDAGLATALRRQAGWACNTLGNYSADVDKDATAAIAAYSRGLAFDPINAMLLRNRAGVQIEQGQFAAAQADIEAAAALEPDAPRLAALRRDLAAAQG